MVVVVVVVVVVLLTRSLWIDSLFLMGQAISAASFSLSSIRLELLID